MLSIEDLEGLYQLALRSPITASDAQQVSELLGKIKKTIADGRQHASLEHARAILAAQVAESKTEKEPTPPGETAS